MEQKSDEESDNGRGLLSASSQLDSKEKNILLPDPSLLEDSELSKKIRLILEKGDNYLHHYARANYSQEINRLSSSLSGEESHFVQALLESNHDGNTPAMVAAKYNNKEALLALLAPIISENESTLDTFLHHKNKDEHNILFLVAHHPGSLFVSWSIIMELEKKVHDNKSFDIKKCLKQHLGTSSAAQTSVQLLQTLQREDKLRAKTTFMQSLGSIFILKVVFYFLDVVTDVLLVSEYLDDWSSDVGRRNAVLFPGQDPCKDHYFISNHSGNVELECYADKLTNKSMFWITLSIILFPPLLFVFELLYFRPINRWFKPWPSSIGARILKFLVNAVLWISWPVVVFFRHFWYLYKYSINHGDKRITTYGPCLKEARTMGLRTQIIEVITEASLQPLVQVYLIFVTIIKWGNSLRTEISLAQESFGTLIVSILSLTPKQVLCVFVSISTLSLSFTAQYRNKKDNVVGILPSLLYFLFTLCFVIARILSFQMFAYNLGPGNFGFAFIGVLGHVILFSILHFVFSDSLNSVQNQSIPRRCFIVLYDCILNGLANLYVHNHIEVFIEKNDSRSKEATLTSSLLRQGLFDAIALMENLAMVLSARNTLKMSMEGVYDTMAIIIGVLCVAGVVLKFTFYSCCHIWSELLVRRNKTLRFGTNMNVLCP